MIQMIATFNLVLLPDTFHHIVVDDADRLTDEPAVTQVVLLVTIEVFDLVLVP